MEMGTKQIGFVNIRIKTATKEIFASKKPYPTKEAAEKGLFYGIGIENVGCFEIEYDIE